MDKTRHPHVIRTWRVERTKVLYRPPRPVKLRSHPFQPFPANRTGPHAAQRPAQSGELSALGELDMVLASQLRSGMAIAFEGQTYRVIAPEYHPG